MVGKTPKVKPPAPASHAPIIFEVLGTPAPKGSSRAMIRGGHAVNVPGSSAVGLAKLKAWATSVRESALELVGSRASPPFVATALDVEIEFRLVRPMGHYGKGARACELRLAAPTYPQGKPDIDKLARTTLDALTGSVIDDDSRIARLSTTKVYAAPGHEGARIRVAAMDGGPELAIAPIPVSLQRPGAFTEFEYATAGSAPVGFCWKCTKALPSEGDCPCLDRIESPTTSRGSAARVREIIGNTAFERDLPGHVAVRHAPPQPELPGLDPDDFGGPDL